MVLVSIAGVWPEKMLKWEKQFESKPGPRDGATAWQENDVGWANLWRCAGVVVSKKVRDDDAKCVGEEQWEEVFAPNRTPYLLQRRECCGNE